MRLNAVLCFAVGLLAPCAGARAADKYNITQAERAACGSDAMQFCTWAYPNEDKLLACMKSNRGSLSAACRVAFDAGVRRRRL